VNPKSPDQQNDERAQVGESLGAALRRARESRNLTLREVSDQTRITRRHLEAIEADDYKQLPGGIFNRSFVKAFARAVGYDVDAAVNTYLKVAKESAESYDDVATTRRGSRIYMDDIPSRSPILTAILSLVILAIISLAAYAGLHYYRRNAERAAQPKTPATNATNTRAPAQNVPANVAASANQPASAPASANAPAVLKVSVRAKGEDVWLRAAADNQPSSDGILKAEQTKEINADQSLKLEYAKVKAAALEVTINGRAAVVPSDAKPGKSLVEMLITKDDYERLLQHP
jgi:cytoskeletal protein RodZ